MKKSVLFLVLVSGSVVLVNGQTPVNDPTPVRKNVQIEEAQRRSNPDFNRLKGVLNPNLQNSDWIKPLPTKFINLTKRDKELISVNNDKSKFSASLKGSNTRILRLHDAEFCDEEGKTIDANEPCPWNIFGKATFYSFRKEDYTTRTFSDIQFEKRTFNVTGLNLLGFLTDLGEISIDNLDLQSKGIKEMAEFEPSTDLDEIKKQFVFTQNGFQIGDYIYKTALQMKLNETYALRSIAYDRKVYRNIGKRKFNILQFDKRRDVIVVFQVIRENDDGSINILWKKLQSKDAPKIKEE